MEGKDGGGGEEEGEGGGKGKPGKTVGHGIGGIKVGNIDEETEVAERRAARTVYC